MRPDPVEILVRNHAAALEAEGSSPTMAREKAEAHIGDVLEELGALGLADVYLGVALRRARVYRMRCQGHTVRVICERLGVCERLVQLDYRAELDRRRHTA